MQRPCALIVAHPGHELFVYGWMKAFQPLVFVLTDGSGRAGAPRIDFTRRLLESLGARRADVFGRYPDTQLYRLIREGHTQVFADLARELAAALVARGVRTVVGDAFERQFLAHDVCRMLIGAAVEIATRTGSQVIHNYAFRLYGYYGNSPARTATAFELALDEETLAAKLAAVRSLPGAGVQHEVDALMARFGMDACRVERLLAVGNRNGFDTAERTPALYETRAEQLVAEGHYPEVIRLRQHVMPIARALTQAIEGSP